MGRRVEIHEAVLGGILSEFSDSDAVRVEMDGESLSVSDAKKRRRIFGAGFREAGRAAAVVPGEAVRELAEALGDEGTTVLEVGDGSVSAAGVEAEGKAPSAKEAHPAEESVFRVPRLMLADEVRRLGDGIAVLAFSGTGVVAAGFSGFLHTDRDVPANNVAVVPALELLRELTGAEGDFVSLSVRDDGTLSVRGGEGGGGRVGPAGPAA